MLFLAYPKVTRIFCTKCTRECGTPIKLTRIKTLYINCTNRVQDCLLYFFTFIVSLSLLKSILLNSYTFSRGKCTRTSCNIVFNIVGQTTCGTICFLWYDIRLMVLCNYCIRNKYSVYIKWLWVEFKYLIVDMFTF